MRDALKDAPWFQSIVEDAIGKKPENPPTSDSPPGDQPADDKPKGESAAPADNAPKAGDNPPPKDAAPKSDDPPKDQGAKQDPAPAAKLDEPAKKADAPKEDAPRKREPDVDVAQVAADAAARAASQTVERLTAAEAKREKQVTEELPPELRKHAAVFAELERMDPAKYKDIGKRKAAFMDAEQRRADEWERENPGKVYNSDDEEHAAWYAKNEPKLSKDDFDEARITVKARAIVQEEVAPKTRQLERELARVRTEPAAQRAEDELVDAVVDAVAPGKKGAEAIAALAESDPDAAEIAQTVAAELRPVAKAIPLLYNGVVDFDANNPSHRSAKQVFQALESDLAKSDPSGLVRDGRRWVPLDQYVKMSAAEQSRAWAVGPDDVVRAAKFLAVNYAKRSYKERQDRFEALAAKRGYAKAAAPNPPPSGDKAPKDDPKPAPSDDKRERRSPASSASAVSGVGSGSSAPAGNDPLSPLWSKMGYE